MKQYNFPGSSNFIKKPVRFPGQLPGYSAILGSDSDDVSGDIIFSEKDHNDREEGGDVQYNQIILDSATKQSSQVSCLNSTSSFWKLYHDFSSKWDYLWVSGFLKTSHFGQLSIMVNVCSPSHSSTCYSNINIHRHIWLISPSFIRQVQIPKYLFLVGLLPFFPLILLFAG